MPRSFNGTSDLITADGARVTDGGAPFTIAMWLKAAGTASGDVYSEANTGAAGPFFQIAAASGKANFSMRSATGGAADASANSTATVFDSTSHHLALTQTTGNLMSLYIDAAADVTFTRTGNSNATSQPLTSVTFGALRRNTTSAFHAGVIAHLATWNRILAVQEVKSLAAGLLPSHLAPTHYWPLWGADSPEPDIVAVGIDGTLTGTTKGAGGPMVGLSMLKVAS